MNCSNARSGFGSPRFLLRIQGAPGLILVKPLLQSLSIPAVSASLRFSTKA